MKLTNEILKKKLRCSTAVALMEKIEQRPTANSNYDVKQDKDFLEFEWPLNFGFLVKDYIAIPKEVHLQGKLESAHKLAKTSLRLRLQYYSKYYEKEEVKICDKKGAIVEIFRMKVTTYDANYDVEAFLNKRCSVAACVEPNAKMYFYD